MTTFNELTSGESEALHVLARGMATRAIRTASDKARGIHGVHSKSADGLIRRGLARDVAQWHAVEITDEGRKVLGPRA